MTSLDLTPAHLLHAVAPERCRNETPLHTWRSLVPAVASLTAPSLWLAGSRGASSGWQLPCRTCDLAECTVVCAVCAAGPAALTRRGPAGQLLGNAHMCTHLHAHKHVLAFKCTPIDRLWLCPANAQL
jgi:hypothetical protein